MAKVKTRDGNLWECPGMTADEMKEAIDKAKKAGSDFVKCGKRWIRTSEIVVIVDREVAPETDEDEDTGWPDFKITIEGVKARVVQAGE